MANDDENLISPVAGAPPAPRIAARPVSPGTQFGNTIRSGIGRTASAATGAAASGVRTADAGLSAVTAPVRAAGGFARDAGRALVGAAPSAQQGRPIAAPSLSGPLRAVRSIAGGPSGPRPTVAARPAAASGIASGISAPMVAARPAAPPSFSAVTAQVDSTANRAGGGVAAPASAAPAAGAGARIAALPAGITRTLDANGNPVYTGTGASVAAAGGPAAGAAVPVPTLAAGAPSIVAPRPTAPLAQRGRQGAIIENPGDTTVDKLMRAMGSASLKGSPSGRAAVAQAILGEAGARQAERASALRLQDDVDLAAGQANAAAAQADAARQMEASQFNATMQDNAANRVADVESARVARRPEVSIAADGGMGIVGSDGSWRPVTGTDGQPVRAAQPPRQTGELTDADRLKSYTDRFNAISSNATLDDTQRQAAIQQLDSDPLYSGLRGSSSAPTFEQFLGDARSKGSKMTDAELRAYFDQTFGQ